MRIVRTLLGSATLLCGFAAAQTAGPFTDIYHVHLTNAAPGKAVALADYLKKPDPKAPMPEHFVVLRHQYGDDWDYAVIEHLGAKATIDAPGSAVPASVRDLSAMHDDTFVIGPSWADFSKAMGIDEGSAAKTANSVYVVSTYRAVPGRRDALEKALSGRDAGDKSVGDVLMQHLEGGAWNYLSVVRYSSWGDLAASEEAGREALRKGTAGWFQIRDDMALHHDTLTDRIAP